MEKPLISVIMSVYNSEKWLHKSIQSSDGFSHIHQFLNVLVEHVSTKRTIVPKEVLEYLNKLYKTKGIT